MTIIQECKESPADQRYDELVHAIRDLGPKGNELGIALDVIVGERLGECTDNAIAQTIGGVVVDGSIQVGGLDGWGVTVRIPPVPETPVSENPTFDECTCYLAEHRGKEQEAEARRIHDLLLSLDGPEGFKAVTELAYQLYEGELFVNDLGRGWFLDGEDFGSFFSQHRWTNPVDAHNLGQSLDGILGCFDERGFVLGLTMGTNSPDLPAGHRYEQLVTGLRRVLA